MDDEEHETETLVMPGCGLLLPDPPPQPMMETNPGRSSVAVTTQNDCIANVRRQDLCLVIFIVSSSEFSTNELPDRIPSRQTIDDVGELAANL